MADEFKPSRKEIEGNERIRAYYTVTLLERIAVALERITDAQEKFADNQAHEITEKKGKKAGGE